MRRFYRALYAAAGLVLRCVFLIPLVCIDEALCVDRDDLPAELRVVYPVVPGLVRKCSVLRFIFLYHGLLNRFWSEVLP